jgi:hypothetical protein
MVSPAYRAVLEPLIEQLQRRLGLGVFKDIVSLTPAKSIHGAVWAAGSRRQWATDHRERDEVRCAQCQKNLAEWRDGTPADRR